jgi:predicted GTPase
MKIILLSGKQNTGKSRTLNILFNKITNSGKDNIVAPRERIGRSDFECVVKYNNNTEVSDQLYS